jgi:hypothetical protein
MKCPRCQYENRPQAKFCEQCATRCPGPAELQHPARRRRFTALARPPDRSRRSGTPLASQTHLPNTLPRKILTSKSAVRASGSR